MILFVFLSKDNHIIICFRTDVKATDITVQLGEKFL